MKVLAVGSSVIDLFLTVDKNHVTTTPAAVQFVLGDKIPSELKSFAVGGNAANVSVGLNRLGISSTLYTYLGNEILSREIEDRLTQEKITLIIDRHEGTAPLHIIVDFGTDRIIFSHYETHPHSFSYSGTDTFEYIYLTSLADEWGKAYENVLEFSQAHTIPIAFSPGSRQLTEMNDTFTKTLKQSTIFFGNKEEAQKIIGTDSDDMKVLLAAIAEHGPQIVSITDGANGGYAIDAQKTMYKIESIKEDAIEKTGAGDAYASGFLAAYLLKYDTIDCMKWGVLNAAAKMKKIGGQDGLLTFDGMKSGYNKTMFLVAQRL